MLCYQFNGYSVHYPMVSMSCVVAKYWLCPLIHLVNPDNLLFQLIRSFVLSIASKCYISDIKRGCILWGTVIWGLCNSYMGVYFLSLTIDACFSGDMEARSLDFTAVCSCLAVTRGWCADYPRFHGAAQARTLDNVAARLEEIMYLWCELDVVDGATTWWQKIDRKKTRVFRRLISSDSQEIFEKLKGLHCAELYYWLKDKNIFGISRKYWYIPLIKNADFFVSL